MPISWKQHLAPAYSCRRLLSTEEQSSSPSKKATSFFSYTSGRCSRRRRRRELKEKFYQKQHERATIEVSRRQELGKDTRTVTDILWPDPFKDDPSNAKHIPIWKRDFASLRKAFRLAITDYRDSWKGFTTSKGFFVEDDEYMEKAKAEQQKQIQAKKTEIKSNVRRNARMLAQESEELRREFRERTGIHSVEDLRRVAGDSMRLASNCVNEFMVGYRKGRDDEVEKMLTQYFQELEEQANKEPGRKRRKPKRRILNPY